MCEGQAPDWGELSPEEHIALLKERNAKAREAMNALVAENAQLRAELDR